MGTGALLLALAAAVVHAAWNTLLAGEEDTHAACAVGIGVGVLLLAPVAAARWQVDAGAVPYLLASAGLELVYLALLATAYTRAQLSVVYPIARGTSPVLVLLVSVTALGVSLSAGAVAGALLVAVGIVLVRGIGSDAHRRDVLLALAIGACIAAYTLVDDEGVTHADPLAYLFVVFALLAVGYAAGVARLRGTAALRTAATRPRTLLIGVGFVASYGLTLAALERAPAAPVAAVRETSVLLATAFAAIVLGERVGRGRAFGAVLVVAGIAAIALGG